MFDTILSQVEILYNSGSNPNKNVILSKYSLHFSTSMEGSQQKKLLQDWVALETSMEGLPNMQIRHGWGGRQTVDACIKRELQFARFEFEHR